MSLVKSSSRLISLRMLADKSQEGSGSLRISRSRWSSKMVKRRSSNSMPRRGKNSRINSYHNLRKRIKKRAKRLIRQMSSIKGWPRIMKIFARKILISLPKMKSIKRKSRMLRSSWRWITSRAAPLFLLLWKKKWILACLILISTASHMRKLRECYAARSASRTTRILYCPAATSSAWIAWTRTLIPGSASAPSVDVQLAGPTSKRFFSLLIIALNFSDSPHFLYNYYLPM